MTSEIADSYGVNLYRPACESTICRTKNRKEMGSTSMLNGLIQAATKQVGPYKKYTVKEFKHSEHLKISEAALSGHLVISVKKGHISFVKGGYIKEGIKNPVRKNESIANFYGQNQITREPPYQEMKDDEYFIDNFEALLVYTASGKPVGEMSMKDSFSIVDSKKNPVRIFRVCNPEKMECPND